MAGPNREQRIMLAIGAAMIAIGICFLVLQLVGVRAIGSWVPVISGVIVLALAVITRLPGFPILGCLLTAGGGGLLWYEYLGDEASDGAAEPVFLLFISGGLLLVPVLTRFLDGEPLLWPLIPGIAGLVTGIVLLI